MANPNTAHEPSMEEILASIRQIISEDGDAPGASEATPPREDARLQAEQVSVEPPKADGPRAESDSRASGQNVDGPARPAQRPGPSAPPTAGEPPLRQPAASPPEPRPAPPRHSEPLPRPEARNVVQQEATPAVRPSQPAVTRPLLSAGSDAAVTNSFSTLAHTILAQNARTLEDLVSEMLRPMLQEWLDDNLPGLVERLVKEEIDRVSRGRR